MEKVGKDFCWLRLSSAEERTTQEVLESGFFADSPAMAVGLNKALAKADAAALANVRVDPTLRKVQRNFSSWRVWVLGFVTFSSSTANREFVATEYPPALPGNIVESLQLLWQIDLYLFPVLSSRHIGRYSVANLKSRIIVTLH